MGMHKAATVLNTENMSYDPNWRRLVADASDVRFDMVALMYDDAADVGVWLKSHKTGNLEPFVFVRRQINGERETAWWTFENARHNLELKIYND